MSEIKDNEKETQEEYSLNDDRRVKVLSPGALVAKRFFRNRVAVVGLIILAVMFVFSFIGGLISPYGEKDFFYRNEGLNTPIGGAKENTDFRFISLDSESFGTIIQAESSLAISTGKEEFTTNGTSYTVVKEGEDFYSVSTSGQIVGLVSKAICYFDNENGDFELLYNCLKAYTNEELSSFEYNGDSYLVETDGSLLRNGQEIGYVSSYIVNSTYADTVFSRDFKESIQYFLESNDEAGNFKRDGENEKIEFNYTDPETGEVQNYLVAYNAADGRWVIKQNSQERVYDTYAVPSKEHPLGTEGNGMDMLTRLMYGGRVSLLIGFIVVFIEISLGIVMGGVAGYFGGWVDFLIMRIIDIMYCIPSMPIEIITGAAMDAINMDPKLRMFFLMLILGLLGWPGIAAMVRAQILSLREQEFMTATEATGLSVYRRIFKHLIPNVMPQLIVSATMGLGGAILAEASLSFLGLGVRFPFASWGNIINQVEGNVFVLTNYLWVWIPPGVCILLTVLAFNLVGDGLRDAFDPKMKR